LKDFIYGIHPVLELLDAGREPESVFIQRGLNNPSLAELKARLRERGVIYKTVPVEKLNRLTRKNHQGVVCFVPQVVYQRAEDIIPRVFEEGRTPLVIVLDRITDVRNFGSICRSAACAGADLVVIPSRGAARVNADAVKAASGALEQVAVAREENLADCLAFLKASGLRVVACTEKGGTTHTDTDLAGPVAIIMGSEESGIAPACLKLADDVVRIPMPGPIASLNVAVAAGIVLFEAVRQRSRSAG